jgi:cholesterol oxidase
VRPPGEGSYAVDTLRTGSWRAGRTAATFAAEQAVFAAGTWGTQRLLHRVKAAGLLPRLSARLGVLTRTNSESLGGAITSLRSRKTHDFTRGVAITSSIHPDEFTHIEPVRHGKGSNAMGLLSTLMTDGGGPVPRWVKWLGQAAAHPGRLISLYGGMRLPHKQSERWPCGPTGATATPGLLSVLHTGGSRRYRRRARPCHRRRLQR